MTGPGSTIDGYQLLEPLGEGPFGVVHRAKDLRRAQPAAVKLLRPHLAGQPLGRQTFGRLTASIKAYAELSHPHLAAVFRTVQDPSVGAYGLAGEYVEGQGLDRFAPALVVAPDGRRLDPGRLARLLGWFEALARAMAWLHARGVVHGNLKPSNVRLLPGHGPAEVKVLDLCWSAIGVARPPPGAESFLSPEQLEGVPPSAASDQWSVVEMLHRALVSGAREVPLSPAAGVPAPLLALLDRGRRRDPGARHAGLQEVAEALAALRLGLAEEPTDRRTEALRAGRPSRPPAAPSSAGAAAPAPQEFGDEPATVKVALATRPAPEPAVLDPNAARSAPPRGAGASPIAARELELGRTADLVPDDEGLEVGAPDLALDVKAEPTLALDAFNLPPEVGLAPAPARLRRARPLARWGGVFLVVAGGLVVGAAQWFKAKTTIATEPVPAARTGAPDAGAAAARGQVDPAATAPAHPEAERPGVTRLPEVALRASDVEAAETRPAQPAGARAVAAKSTAAAAGGNRALDAKADEAMAKLAALSGGVALESGAKREASDPRAEADVRCDEGNGAACLTLGGLWQSAEAGANQADKARKAYERACNFQSAEGCHRAAIMVRDGQGGAADEARARELEARACKLGRAKSCRAETETSTRT